MSEKLKRLAKTVFQMELTENGCKSEGPHLGGAFLNKRIFGGQVVGQAWETLRQHMKDRNKDEQLAAVYHTFIGPGKTDEPIEYKVVESIDNVHLVAAEQNNKLVGLTRLRTEATRHSGKALDLEYVKGEEEYLTLDELGKDTPLIPEEKILQREAAENMVKLFVFQLKFVEFNERIEENKRNILYVRYRPELKDFATRDNTVQILLTVSDFFIFEVVSQLLTEHGLHMKTGASLHHHVTVHGIPDDPFDWLLFRTEVVHIGLYRCLIRGIIYDSKGQRLLSITQEGYCHTENKANISKI